MHEVGHNLTSVMNLLVPTLKDSLPYSSTEHELYKGCARITSVPSNRSTPRVVLVVAKALCCN